MGMSNLDNLRTPTTDEAREIGRKGGLASGAARRKKKACAEIAMRIINAELTVKDRAKLEEMVGPLDDDEATLYAAALGRMVANAVKGDVRAFHELQSVVEKSQGGFSRQIECDPLSAALKELGETL